MTTKPLSLNDGLPVIPKRIPTVRIRELPLCSPTREESEAFAHGVVEIIGQSPETFLNNLNVLEGMSLKRPRSGGHNRRKGTRPDIRRRSSSLGSIDGLKVADNNLSNRQDVSVEPHKHRNADNGDIFPVNAGKEKRSNTDRDTTSDSLRPPEPSAAPVNLLGPLPPRGWFSPSQFLGQVSSTSSGVVGPLTPPEDLDSFKWESPSDSQSTEGIYMASTAEQFQTQGQTLNLHRTSSASRPSEIQLPEPSDIGSGDSSTPNWLGRACQQLGKSKPTSVIGGIC
jgi:hypothetical protein